MKQLLKWIGAIISVGLAALIAAVIAVTLFINPNQFKPLIITQFKQMTGFDISIPGNLSWSFFPRLGMQADEVTINDPSVFTSKIKNMVLLIRMKPLLHKQLEFSKVTMDEVQFNHLLASHIKARVQIKDKILDIKPLTAELYHGNLAIAIRVSLKQPLPEIHIATTLKEVDMAALIIGMTGKASKLQLTGKGDIAAELTSQGKQTDDLIKDLRGVGRLTLDKGTMQGIDIGFYVDTAVALINNQPLPTRALSNQTEIGKLTGTAEIKDGIMHSNDLILDSPYYTTHGTGTINLVTKTLDYHLEVTAKPGLSKEKVLALYNKTVPIRITGNLENPSIALDTLGLMHELGKEQLQKVGESIQKALPEKANQFIKNLFH